MSGRITDIRIDDSSLPPPTPEIEQERRVAVFDLLEDNSFSLAGRDGGPSAEGPFHLALAIRERRLVFDIRTEDEAPAAEFRWAQTLEDLGEVAARKLQYGEQLAHLRRAQPGLFFQAARPCPQQPAQPTEGIQQACGELDNGRARRAGAQQHGQQFGVAERACAGGRQLFAWPRLVHASILARWRSYRSRNHRTAA